MSNDTNLKSLERITAVLSKLDENLDQSASDQVATRLQQVKQKVCDVIEQFETIQNSSLELLKDNQNLIGIDNVGIISEIPQLDTSAILKIVKNFDLEEISKKDNLDTKEIEKKMKLGLKAISNHINMLKIFFLMTDEINKSLVGIDLHLIGNFQFRPNFCSNLLNDELEPHMVKNHSYEAKIFMNYISRVSLPVYNEKKDDYFKTVGTHVGYDEYLDFAKQTNPLSAKQMLNKIILPHKAHVGESIQLILSQLSLLEKNLFDMDDWSDFGDTSNVLTSYCKMMGISKDFTNENFALLGDKDEIDYKNVFRKPLTNIDFDVTNHSFLGGAAKMELENLKNIVGIPDKLKKSFLKYVDNVFSPFAELLHAKSHRDLSYSLYANYSFKPLSCNGLNDWNFEQIWGLISQMYAERDSKQNIEMLYKTLCVDLSKTTILMGLLHDFAPLSGGNNVHEALNKYENLIFPYNLTIRDAGLIHQIVDEKNRGDFSELIIKYVWSDILLLPHVQFLILHIFGYFKFIYLNKKNDTNDLVKLVLTNLGDDFIFTLHLLLLIKISDFVCKIISEDKTNDLFSIYHLDEFQITSMTGSTMVNDLNHFFESLPLITAAASIFEKNLGDQSIVYGDKLLQTNYILASSNQMTFLANLVTNKITDFNDLATCHRNNFLILKMIEMLGYVYSKLCDSNTFQGDTNIFESAKTLLGGCENAAETYNNLTEYLLFKCFDLNKKTKYLTIQVVPCDKRDVEMLNPITKSKNLKLLGLSDDSILNMSAPRSSNKYYKASYCVDSNKNENCVTYHNKNTHLTSNLNPEDVYYLDLSSNKMEDVSSNLKCKIHNNRPTWCAEHVTEDILEKIETIESEMENFNIYVIKNENADQYNLEKVFDTGKYSSNKFIISDDEGFGHLTVLDDKRWIFFVPNLYLASKKSGKRKNEQYIDHPICYRFQPGQGTAPKRKKQRCNPCNSLDDYGQNDWQEDLDKIFDRSINKMAHSEDPAINFKTTQKDVLNFVRSLPSKIRDVCKLSDDITSALNDNGGLINVEPLNLTHVNLEDLIELSTDMMTYFNLLLGTTEYSIQRVTDALKEISHFHLLELLAVYTYIIDPNFYLLPDPDFKKIYHYEGVGDILSITNVLADLNDQNSPISKYMSKYSFLSIFRIVLIENFSNEVGVPTLNIHKPLILLKKGYKSYLGLLIIFIYKIVNGKI